MVGVRTWLRPNAWLATALLCGLAQGCAGHEHAPAVVPATAPVTTAGDRFDVAVPKHTPVTIVAAAQDPDDEWYRAFRYDWVAGGEARRGQREAREGPLELPAVAERGYLYVDAVHRPPGAAAEQKSNLVRGFERQRLGEGVWRLHFRDPDAAGPGDDLVVTVRFRGRQAAASAPAATQPATRPSRAPAVAAPAAPQTWGEQELGRPVKANPCSVCGTTDRLVYRATHDRELYWIRCDKCARSNVSKPSPAEAERAWNEENPLPTLW